MLLLLLTCLFFASVSVMAATTKSHLVVVEREDCRGEKLLMYVWDAAAGILCLCMQYFACFVMIDQKFCPEASQNALTEKHCCFVYFSF